MAFTEYGSFDALGLAALVKAKKVKPSEIVDAAIGRAEAINPNLNAIGGPAYVQSRTAAKC